MIGRFPDKPTPIGCLVGFFVLIAGALSTLAFWGVFKAFSKEPPAVEAGNSLILWGVIGLVPALIGFVFCISRISSSGKFINKK